jgi:CBS domain-containing protein
MHAKDMMTSSVVTVWPETTVPDIANLLLSGGLARCLLWTRAGRSSGS